ncbi:MgtC/SapB family protein [Mycobacterium tuberculosis]|uniref:MgtC/SapB family protein n=1 Tax=Mycobacterium tuberculosis TaxID=1773 RepID=UPI003D7C25B5
MAGLRTNALVATGATLFVLYAVATEDSSPTQWRPTWFLELDSWAAGSSCGEGSTSAVVNTAATLWCSAAVECWPPPGIWCSP